MEFITGKCPKCSGELQIPRGRDTIICMYCGEEIKTSQAVSGAQEAKTVSQEKKERHQEYVQQAMEGFPQMLFSIKDPLKDFKKNLYEGSFKAFEENNREIMDAIEDAYLTSEEPQQLVRDLAKEFVSRANNQMKEKKKRNQEEALMNFNMSIVIYINPALIDYNKSSGMPLVEELLRQWKESFPKTNLKVSDFEHINSGFKRRFCYITTAVCESLNRPDDCYELNLLRDYRDKYLMQLEEGEQLVKKYYDVAPTIVKHINKKPEHTAIYEEIWRTYLSPCIRLIEENENEKCQSLYREMVDTLALEYFN